MLEALRRHLHATPGVCDRPGFHYELAWVGRFLESSQVPAQEPIVTCLADAFRDVTGRDQEMGSMGMSDRAAN